VRLIDVICRDKKPRRIYGRAFLLNI
jgi:hypothetical protein